MSRDLILAQLAASLKRRSPPSAIKAATSQRSAFAPELHGQFRADSGNANLLSQFVQSLERRKARVLLIENEEDIPLAAGRIIFEGLGANQTLRVGSDPVLTSLTWHKVRDLLVLYGPGQSEDRATMSNATAGIAETGTLVLTSGPENPTSLAFLPEMHLVTINRKAIVMSMEDAFAKIRKNYGPGQMPRAVNLISGPSRTGDIGGRIVVGAHGPQRLAVLIF